jgi:predicted negative regulator of RcsB-dependent stress response
MIRRFFTTVFILALMAGCGYYWWQTAVLSQKIVRLEAEVAGLRSAAKGSAKHRSESRSDETSGNAPAEGYLALADDHLGKAQADFDKRNLGDAQSELSLALDDFHKATLEPEQATAQDMAVVRDKIGQFENALSKLGH